MELPSISQTRLSSKKLSQHLRLDRGGHPILKGRKLHSVTFIDHVISGSPLHQTFIIDSWKEHNQQESKCCSIQ